MEGRPHKLLESVADRLANEILNDYHQVQGVQLHLKKPHVAVTGVVESLGKSKGRLIPASCAQPQGMIANLTWYDCPTCTAGIEIIRYRTQS